MSWFCLLPPLVVFLIGVLTHRVSTALIIGLILGAFIAGDGDFIDAWRILKDHVWSNLEIDQVTSWGDFLQADHLLIISFLLGLGILVEMIRRSRSAFAFVHFCRSFMQDKRSVETGALVLSHFLCLDDYLSSLTVGSVMRPLTDRFRIPREKLAFLADSMSAPLTVISPISSWAAAIIGFLSENGIQEQIGAGVLLLDSPYQIYLRVLPFVFYSYSLIAMVWWMVRWRLSYGEMRRQELHAEEKVEPSEEQFDQDDRISASLFDFFLPIFTLFIGTFGLILFFGKWSLMGGDRSFIEALQRAPISPALLFATLIALIVSGIRYLIKGLLSWKELCSTVGNGMRLMYSACCVLLLAWVLGTLLRIDLRTGDYLASLLSQSISIEWLPFIMFINASLISLALGSSWGTAAILFPIALPMTISMYGLDAPVGSEQLSILFPVFGAILSGSVFGNHISLIADTTVMASASASCNHMAHVNTQFGYAMPICIATAIGFLFSGYLAEEPLIISLGVPLFVSMFLSCCFSHLLHLYYKRSSSLPKSSLGQSGYLLEE